jgi:hypothetical protein
MRHQSIADLKRLLGELNEYQRAKLFADVRATFYLEIFSIFSYANITQNGSINSLYMGRVILWGLVFFCHNQK